ncbi:MAG: class I SAM-dependent DNA methyltransferase [Chloroflexi bacterium]|nr:class I SAM-dependent DNA methyltransferase [Chloroflexota bacterium]
MTPMMPSISPQEFVDRWRDAGFGERQGAQSFFNDLCGLVGHATPAAYGDPEAFTFEKAVPGGSADAYFEEHFGWEFKGQDAQLDGAFVQLLRYQVHLKTPPLLIVSSFDTIRIQTNFPGMETARYDVDIGEFTRPERLELLRDVFFAPHRFRERLRSVDAVTRETAAVFQAIVVDMERASGDNVIPHADAWPERLARYLNQLVFCLYSEDAGLLPEGLFTRIVAQHYRNPATFDRAVRSLFAQMATGGFSGADEIAHFNGDLFKSIDGGPVDTVELSAAALQRLGEACERNWRDIEPSIFGTLFERALDASKRAQTGAHYTGADDIELVVEPVVMTPLRREWEEARREIEELLDEDDHYVAHNDIPPSVIARNDSDVAIPSAQQRSLPQRDCHAALAMTGEGGAPMTGQGGSDVANAARARLEAFRERLASVKVLDPACGSGNFLYIALRSLLDLEKEVIDYAAAQGWLGLTPQVQPDQMLGLEINHYAAELARTALWIGYIQWHQANGFAYTQRPILTPLNTIRQTDAILDLSDPDNPAEPEWPAAEFIVGNPPFLGGKLLRTGLSDEYVDALFKQYDGKVPAEADLVCYWFDKGQRAVEAGNTKRAGLLATQGIRGGANRKVLQRIQETGDIFMAWSDHPWVLEGAAVHISIVGFDDGSEVARELDGQPVTAINASLAVGVDLTTAKRLEGNLGIAFMGDTKGGPFDIPSELADAMLTSPNPHGQSNVEVLRPWVNGRDITSRSRGMWIIDFGNMTVEQAALFEAPFEYANSHVKPMRAGNRRALYADKWWWHMEPRPGMREALQGFDRYIATPTVSKHRLFVWLPKDILSDHNLIVFSRDDDYTFGVLHSRFHELWALAMGTQLETRPRYTPTTCFETFPFPRPTEEQREAIGAIAAELDRLREGWLNPEGVSAAELKRRTLTNLYNQRPTWLDNIHARLDAAVADAYGWPADLADGEILERLLALNLERAGELT